MMRPNHHHPHCVINRLEQKALSVIADIRRQERLLSEIMAQARQQRDMMDIGLFEMQPGHHIRFENEVGRMIWGRIRYINWNNQELETSEGNILPFAWIRETTRVRLEVVPNEGTAS